MPDNSPKNPKPVIGQTWADLITNFIAVAPKWVLSAAATVFVFLVAYAMFFADRPIQLGVLGSWGPIGPNQRVQAFPLGAVVAFDLNESTGLICPDGWSFFEAGGGRVIVGAGDHNNKWYETKSDTPIAIPIYPTYAQDERTGLQETSNARSTGGEPEVRLTLEEMPSHHHDYVTRGDLMRQSGSDTRVWVGDSPATTTDAGGLPGGSTQPHNNMPPYIALYFCKKG